MLSKEKITGYSPVLIQADIDFLEFMIKKNNVALIEGTGLKKLIDDCISYLRLDSQSEFGIDTLKPLLVLHSLSDTLRTLWMKRKTFAIQLRAMNTGDFAYGVPSVDEGINFKDFELEIFTAAYLNEFNVEINLPQDTVGNDLMYKDIEIQCKHPLVFNRQKIDGFLREFQSSLQKTQKYGVFGIGVDDFLGFSEKDFPYDDEKIIKAYKQRLYESDHVLTSVFDDTLRFCPRVLGVYLINTHFMHSPKLGPTLTKMTNSVFCLRPNAKDVPEELHRQAYEILSVFNPKPSIRKY
jgi:hypothetical protein